LLISLKKFRMYIIHHRMMVLGWTKILADGDQVAVCLAEVPKKTADFL
jgi:membrane-bound acyltransferase YfiQ involved in biofilm formation